MHGLYSIKVVSVIKRVRTLSDFNLIITEKGRNVPKIMEDMIQLVDEE